MNIKLLLKTTSIFLIFCFLEFVLLKYNYLNNIDLRVNDYINLFFCNFASFDQYMLNSFPIVIVGFYLIYNSIITIFMISTIYEEDILNLYLIRLNNKNKTFAYLYKNTILVTIISIIIFSFISILIPWIFKFILLNDFYLYALNIIKLILIYSICISVCYSLLSKINKNTCLCIQIIIVFLLIFIDHTFNLSVITYEKYIINCLASILILFLGNIFALIYAKHNFIKTI